MTLKRDQQIVALKEQGWASKDIAASVGLSPSRVTAICRNYRGRRDAPPLPPGISTKTAQFVKQTIGVWPSPETADFIVKRLTVIMAGTRGSRAVRELGVWLQSLGLIP